MSASQYYANKAMFINDTDTHAGVWVAIQALEDTVINALVSANLKDDAGADVASMKLPAGVRIFGLFTSIDLASGSVIAYESTEE